MAGRGERLRLPLAMNAKCAHLHGQCRTTPRWFRLSEDHPPFGPFARHAIAGDSCHSTHGRQQESQTDELLAALRANRQINGTAGVFSPTRSGLTPVPAVICRAYWFFLVIGNARLGRSCDHRTGFLGLCTLERIIDAGRRAPSRAISVRAVEPARPSGGLYSHAGPDYYLLLNPPRGQHSIYPYPERVGEDRLGKSFYEWLVERCNRWHGYECRNSTIGQAISPHDFHPRRLMGGVRGVALPGAADGGPNVSVVRHKTRAVVIEATPYGRESVHTETGARIDVDHVILTLGHTQEAARAEVRPLVTSPYPVQRYHATVSPRGKVAIEGMGLVALDAVAALTIGLGGRFTTEQSAKLRYHPSGRGCQLRCCRGHRLCPHIADAGSNIISTPQL